MLPKQIGIFCAGDNVLSYKNTVLQDLPEGYWRLNDASSPFTDYGEHNDSFGLGVGTDTTLEVTGPVQNDSGSLGITMGTANTDYLGNTSWLTYIDTHTEGTVEAWIKRHPTDTSKLFVLVSVDTSAWSDYIRIYYNVATDVFVFNFRDSVASTSMYTPIVYFNTSEWYHVAVVSHPTGSALLYINGILSRYNDASGTGDGSWFSDLVATNALNSLFFNYAGTDEYSGGSLSELAIYDTRVAPRRLLAHYNRAKEIIDYETGVLADSPLAYWRMDEASGNITDEVSSTVLTASGTIVYSKTSLVSTDTNTAIELNGTSYFYINNHAAYQITGDMVMEMWVQLDAIDTQHILCTCSGGAGETEADNILYQFYIDSSNKLNVLWEYGASGTDELVTTTSAVDLHADTPTHLGFIRDTVNKKVLFVVNGLLEEEVTYTNNPTGGGNGDFYIGDGTNGLDGIIDEFAIYDEVIFESLFGRRVIPDLFYHEDLNTEVTITLSNPGSESSMTSWTNDAGNTMNVGSTTSYSHHSGSRHFQGSGGSPGDSGIAQSEEFSLEGLGIPRIAVDNGSATISVTYWQHSEYNEDKASCGVRFMDASKTKISDDIRAVEKHTSWTQKTHTATVPVGTRYVHILIKSSLVVGTWGQGGIDDITAKYSY